VLDQRVKEAAHDLEIHDSNATPQRVMVQRDPSKLPVYVRAGAILPLAPIVQSTDEKPEGPLTLRVFPGDNCSGDLYQDDGKSYDFRSGAYLRLHFTCSVEADGSVIVHLPPILGNFAPWWTRVRVEIVHGNASGAVTSANGHTVPIEVTPIGVAVTIPYLRESQEITFR
jgi:alpha-glucosidase